MSDDPFARLREGFLQDAETLPWPEIWLRCARARSDLIAAAIGLTDAQAAWAPATGEGEEAWSAAQVIRHLITATPNVAAIIEATARGESAPKDPPGTIKADDAPVAELRDRLVAVSEELLSVGRRLPDRPDSQTTVPHAFFGDLPSRAWILFQAFHDRMHADQLNDLREAQGLDRA